MIKDALKIMLAFIKAIKHVRSYMKARRDEKQKREIKEAILSGDRARVRKLLVGL